MMRSAILVLGLAAAAVPSSPSHDVRIGVFSLFHPRDLILRPASGAAIVVRTNRDTCVLRGRDEAHVALVNGAMRLTCGTTVTIARAVSVAGVDDDAADVELSVPDRIARRFRGRVDIRASGGELRPVVAMDLETAVASVVAAEQPSSSPIEALKAQAVAARSYLVAARGRHSGFDFCDTTHCQFLREPAAAESSAARAARDTRGLVVAFRDQPVAALYSASCGGRTRSLADAGFPTTDGYPYFSVDCAYCARHASGWTRQVKVDGETERLARDRSEATRLAVGRRNGWSSVPGANFELMRELDWFVLQGRGQGHAIGLCQAGAAGMALESGTSFLEILTHYYPSTTVRPVR